MNTSIEMVRERLQGKSIAIIGGDYRDKHAARLRKEFGLAEVIWIPTRDTDASSRKFESLIKRGEVALVVLLHGLIRHQHASDARRLCKEASIPLVPYWRSPHPRGLAEAILHSTARSNCDLDRLFTDSTERVQASSRWQQAPQTKPPYPITRAGTSSRKREIRLKRLGIKNKK